MKNLTILFTLLIQLTVANAQNLKLKPRKPAALSGSAFAKAISDSTLSLAQRENLIFKEIKSGNVPDFLRKLKEIKDSNAIRTETLSIRYFVLPDYVCIGSNEDFFYIPMTPILAQKVADLTKCSLPTKKMVDLIYKNVTIKLEPQPIPPTKAMTTLPVFITHNEMINKQLQSYISNHNNSELTAGNKKDIIISNKIYGEQTNRVVIYGWHKLDRKAIQPIYNKHTNTWADYSHGTRLIQNRIWINGKKTTLQKALSDIKLATLLSDEGIIKKAYYPIFNHY